MIYIKITEDVAFKDPAKRKQAWLLSLFCWKADTSEVDISMSRDLVPSLPSVRNFPRTHHERRVKQRETSSSPPNPHHQNHISHTQQHNMPPKGPARVGAGRPAQNNSYVRNAINELSSPENRSVVVAVSFFAVSNPTTRHFGAVDERGERGGLASNR